MSTMRLHVGELLYCIVGAKYSLCETLEPLGACENRRGALKQAEVMASVTFPRPRGTGLGPGLGTSSAVLVRRESRETPLCVLRVQSRASSHTL